MSLVGDWARVKDRLEHLSDDLKAEIGKSTAVSLQQIEKKVVGHLNKQDLNWVPLSEKYARFKARTRTAAWRRKRKRLGKENPRSLSEKTLIATSKYREAITSTQTGPFSGEVGVSRNETYNGGESIANIGIIHEEGSRDGKIPQRELWQPTADEMAEKVTRNFLNAANKVLKNV